MNEFELIRRFFVRQQGGSGVVVGIGDDGAVLEADPGLELVSVIDSLVQGVHFPDGFDAEDLGYRVVAVNLSDIAAMGARPRWMTLALTLPDADTDWLTRFAAGLFAAASEYQVALVGGDTTSGEQVVATVHLLGDVESGKALLRSGARPGDGIYVTGTLGDAAAGLALSERGIDNRALAERYRRPAARVAAGRTLAGVASAAIDVSDGLLGDLGKLLAASGVGAVVDVDRLPLSPALLEAIDRGDAEHCALTGGDDYELCFTSRVTPNLDDVPVTKIGDVMPAEELIVRKSGAAISIDDSGYRHFQ